MSKIIPLRQSKPPARSPSWPNQQLPVMVHALGDATTKLSIYVSESRKTLTENIRSIDAIIETIKDPEVKDMLRARSMAIRSALADI